MKLVEFCHSAQAFELRRTVMTNFEANNSSSANPFGCPLFRMAMADRSPAIEGSNELDIGYLDEFGTDRPGVSSRPHDITAQSQTRPPPGILPVAPIILASNPPLVHVRTLAASAVTGNNGASLSIIHQASIAMKPSARGFACSSSCSLLFPALPLHNRVATVFCSWTLNRPASPCPTPPN